MRLTRNLIPNRRIRRRKKSIPNKISLNLSHDELIGAKQAFLIKLSTTNQKCFASTIAGSELQSIVEIRNRIAPSKPK